MHQVRTGIGIEEARAILVVEVTSIVEFLNVGKTMSRSQVEETVNLILLDYSHLTLADFKLFGDRFKKGVYGKQYDRIDGQVVLQALGEYFNERCEVMAEMHSNEHYRREKDLKMQDMHPDVIKVIKEAIGDKKIGKRQESKPQPETYPVQRWVKQFNNLHGKYGIANKGIRMIMLGGVPYDVNLFLERKLSNNQKRNA